ncbi:c-type cytochrome [Allomesorhizobium camelthorni]|uniref:c-type cytochrome n=1 Tax=Allomesorhizobium camelthorni TaxID=475069 RepID=UPI00198029C9
MLVVTTVIGTTAVAADDPLPHVLDSKQIGAGRAFYGQYCASCHGANGKGAPNWREPNRQGELPSPPHNQEGHTWRHSDADLYEIISKGWRDPFNKTDRITMPPFGETLAPEEIRAVIAYLKSLWTDEQRRYQREESEKEPFPAEAKPSPE